MKKILYIPLDWHRDSEGHFDDVKQAFAKQCEVEIFATWKQKEFTPDIIFFQGSLSVSELKNIKESTGAKVVMWTGDAGYMPPQSFMDHKDTVDLYLMPFLGENMKTYATLLKKPCNYIWEFIQDWRFREPIEIEKSEGSMISFVGNIYDHLPGGEVRNKTMAFLWRHVPELFCWGNGFKNGPIEYTETPDIYNNSYLVIAENNLMLDGYFTPRNIGGMAAGSCVLHKWFPRIEHFFRHLEDGMVYKNEYELLQQINFLKANPDMRNELAKKSYNTAKQYWTLDAWVGNLLTTIDKFIESQKEKISENETKEV